ncbi:MAG: hydantoinase/oxoprolinase family protein, partial [Hydrogenophaga sp.]|nr:hydantoinase/oxoprolinase family protein [Hydrogenophaga sp.]
ALKVKASRDMYAEGYEAGNYAIEARLVADFGNGREETQSVDDDPVFPAAFAKAGTVELELKAVKALRTEGAKKASFTRGKPAVSVGVRNVLTRGMGRVDVPVYQLAQLQKGDWAIGPAILEEDFFTCRVLDGWAFVVSDAGDVLLNRKG